MGLLRCTMPAGSVRAVSSACADNLRRQCSCCRIRCSELTNRMFDVTAYVSALSEIV